MIIINGSMELMTVTVNEAYKKVNDEWVKALVARFPKEEYSLETATAIADEANVIEITSGEKVITYYVDEILEAKPKAYYTEIWLLNPEVSVTNPLNTKVSELETIVNTLIGGEG